MKQQDGAILKEEVSEEEIASVVAAWTGIPVAKMMPVSYTHLDVYKRQMQRRSVNTLTCTGAPLS